MKSLENVVIGAITTQMPRDENGEIIDKFLHSDLINAVNQAFSLYNVVGRSEQSPQKSEHCVSISSEPCKHKGVCEICS